MKKWILLVCYALSLEASESKFVTLTGNESLEIGPSEAGEVVSIVGCTVGVHKGKIHLGIGNPDRGASFEFKPFVVAGPARFEVGSCEGGFSTIRVISDAVDPSRVLRVPSGTNAIIHFEASTNLVDWTVIASVGATNSNTNAFFRVRIQTPNN